MVEFEEAPDPTSGIGPAVRFFVEGLLAIGITLRVAGHVVGAGLVSGEQPTDVDTGLQLEFAVSNPTLSRPEQVRVAAVWSGFVAAGGAMMWLRASISAPALAVIAVSNYLVVAGDVIWLLLGYLVTKGE